MNKDDVAEQLRRHALITALAVMPHGAGAMTARELALANAARDDEKFFELFSKIPGAPERKHPGIWG